MRLFGTPARISPRSQRLPRAAWVYALVAWGSMSLSGFSRVEAQTADEATAPRVMVETLAPNALTDATDAGPLPSSQELTVTLTFARTPDRAAALKQFLTDLTTASSPNYRKWITPAQFAASYGATSDQIAAATAWAQAQGLVVQAVSPSGSRLTVTGFAPQVQSAFAVIVHQFQIGGFNYFANTTQPSLPASAAALFQAIEGLDNLPRDLKTLASGPSATPATTVNSKASPLSVATLGGLIDQNATPMMTIDATNATGTPSAPEVAGYEVLFEQAAAQGVTALLTRAATSGGFPSGLDEVTAVANTGDVADTQTPFAVRPNWQTAPGLPEDNLRHAPDLTAASASALATTLSSIAVSISGGRLGNVNPVLYELGPTPGLYTQPDSARAGTWEAATGLGLVDLEKLAKAFPRGSSQSYASISLSSYSVTYGTPITFTSNVTSGVGGAVPSGTVAFVLGNGTTLATVSVVSGTASYTSTPTQIDAGTVTVQAVYSGDGTYAGAQSNSPQFYVGPEQSDLSAVVSTGTTLGGTYSVAVTDVASNGVGTPTGNVTLQVQGTSTSLTQALTPGNGASANTTFSSVPANTVGTLTLQITCTTSTDYTCYNPYTTTVMVGKGTPGIRINYTPNPPVSGQTISLTASVSGVGSGPVPTGSVTFYDNNTVLNSANLTNGTVTETGTVPTTATHNISATYNGDPNYNAVSTSTYTPPTGSTVTTTLLTSSASTVAGGQSFTLSMVVTPKTVVNNAAPTGLVQILDNGTLIATTSALSSGSTTYTLSLATTGSHSLTAYYPGDTNYAASTSPAVPITVTSSAGAATTTLVTSSSYSVTYGQTFTLTAAVTPSATNANSPTGNVTFALAGTTLATVPLTNGKASYELTAAQLPNAGSYNYIARYGGDGNFASSVGTTTSVTVTAATAAITATINPNTVGTGASTTVSATVTIPSSLVAPSGSVTVTVPGVAGAVYDGTLITTGTNAGSTNVPVPAPPSGNYTLQVTCNSNANYTCNTTTVGLTSTAAAKTTTTTSLSASSYSITAGQSVTLTATVTPSAIINGVSPTGTVNFVSATQGVLAANVAVVDGVATATLTNLADGSYTLSADYSGDATYGSSSGSASNVLTVSGSSSSLIPTTTTLTLSPASPTAGQQVVMMATVTSTTTGASPISGTVYFYEGTTELGSGPVANGIATADVTLLSTPLQALTAVYSGDTIYQGSSGSQTTGLTATTTTLIPSSYTGVAGSTVTLTAYVAGAVASGASPTGSVSFYVSGTTPQLLGTEPLTPDGSGQAFATLYTANIPAGTPTLYAVYSGDTTFAQSTSKLISLGLSDYAITFTPPNITLTPGQTGTVTLTVTTTGGFSGTIAIGCTPPADLQITCSLSQSQFTGPGTTTLSIFTVAPKSAENRRRDFGALGGVSLAALLCFVLPGRNRRRLPGMLLVLLAIGLTTNLGCMSSVGTTTAPVGGTPLGTVNLEIYSVGSNGSSEVNHDYSYQVTIQ